MENGPRIISYKDLIFTGET